MVDTEQIIIFEFQIEMEQNSLRSNETTQALQAQQLHQLQEQFLRSSSEQNSEEDAELLQFQYVSNNLFQKKSKSKFMTPFNKFIDKDALRKSCQSKKQELSNLKKTNKQLRQKYSQNMFLRRELEEALFKLSQALPSSVQKQTYFNLKQKQAIQSRNIVSKQQLMKLKRSVKSTYKFQFNILKSYLETHNQKLNKQLKSLMKQDEEKEKKIALEGEKQQRYRQLLCQIQMAKNSWMLNVKCNLLAQKIEQDNASIKLKDIRTKLIIQEIKKKKQLLQKIRLQNTGLIYEEQLFHSNKQQISSIEEDIEKYKLSSNKKQKTVYDLQHSLKDKKNVCQYIKQWSEELKQKLEEKKKGELAVKVKLESRINSLSKQFQEWSSKYKMLMMHDQTVKLNRSHKQFKINDKYSYGLKLRMIKEYQIQPICKRINFQLCLRGISKQSFISQIMGCGKTINIKQIYQNLKKNSLLESEFHPEFLKISRYISQDNTKDQVLNKNIIYLETSTAKLIFSNMIGSILSQQQIQEEQQRIIQIMKKYYWNIVEKLPILVKTQMVSEERLKDSFMFLGARFLTTTFKAICLKMYQFNKAEVNRYPLHAFKTLFQRYALKKTEPIEELDEIYL